MQVENAQFFTEVCSRIRALAANKGLSNIDIANRGDIAYRTVYQVMQGNARLRGKSIGRFARVLGTTAEYLLGETPDPAGGETVVKESAVVWHADAPRGPCALKDAVRTIAQACNVGETDVYEKIIEMLVRDRKERST